MKNIFLTLMAIGLFYSSNSYAAYVRMAECYGRTDRNNNARVLIFVNNQDDTRGTVTVSFDNGTDYVSDTRVNWTSNREGFPRFYDNDFDLDIVINNKTKSQDDFLVENEYISRLECSYSPNK